MDNRDTLHRAAKAQRSSPLRRGAALLVALTCAAASAIVLGGCSNNPNPKPLHETREDGAPWVPTYRILPEGPRSLDPQYSYDTVGHAIIGQVYESLLQYNLFKTSPYELEPCLTDGMPERVQNPDGTETYIIRLKKGITFHDDPCFPGGKGRELTAHDFFYTFQRIADPKVECPVLSTLQEFIVGLGEAYTAARESGKPYDYSKPSGAITVIDDHTFHLHLKRPYPQILYWLAMPFTAPVPREAVEYYDGKGGRDLFKFHPVGTGPFAFNEWIRGRILRLERHRAYKTTHFPTSGWPAEEEAYYRPMAGKPLPFLDEAQFLIIREPTPAWLLFRQGYTDRSGVGKDAFSSAITEGLTLSPRFEERGVRLTKDVEAGTFYIQFNMDDPVVGKNTDLRRAISMAYDEERANQIFRNGVDLKAEQLLPPGVIGYDPEFRNKYREYNLEEAGKLLAKAGYPNGRDKNGKQLELTLDVVATDPSSRQRAEFDRQQIEQLGIRCRIEENTWARFQDKMRRGNFQMNSGSGWLADYPDPENFFFLFYGKNIPPMGNNYAHFQNAEFDELFRKMATMENGPERQKIIARMTAILTEEAPVIFTSHRVSFILSQPWLNPLPSNAMLSVGPGLKYASLDPEMREEKRREWNRAPLWPTIVLAALALFAIGYAINWARRSNL